MPFLNDQELEDLQLEIKDLNSKNEELEIELNERVEEIGDIKSTARNRNILLSFLAGIAIAFAVYFYKNGSSLNINDIKKQEATRVLDSINDASADIDDYSDEDENSESNEENEDSISASEAVSNLKGEIKGKTVYSVQIAALTERNYPVLSKTIAGTLTNGEYLRYSVGLFDTLKEAQKFRKALVRMGFEDAFVASYKNGKRQQIQNPY